MDEGSPSRKIRRAIDSQEAAERRLTPEEREAVDEYFQQMNALIVDGQEAPAEVEEQVRAGISGIDQALSKLTTSSQGIENAPKAD